MQGSLWGDERLLIIEEPRFLRSGRRGEDGDSSKEASDESAWQEVFALLQEELTVVLVHPGTYDRRRRMARWLEKEATLVECAPLKSGEMLRFIQMEFQIRGMETAYGVPEQIQKLAGDACGIAITEIDKLQTAFPSNERISSEAARAILSQSVDEEVYTLFDLISEGKLQEAYLVLDRLLYVGEAATRVIAAIARQLRQMLQLKALAAQGVRGDSAARQLGLHAFFVRRLGDRAALYSDMELVELLVSCCQMDASMKSGQVGMASAVDVVLGKMAQAASSR